MAERSEELFYTSATALAAAMRAKKISSEEIVNACLKRIEQVNPKLNAVVQLTAERARADARTADAALARGEIRGPLHGVPITLKDSIDTAGVITTGGTKGRARFVPEADATVAARMKAAGAILLGKTNTPELTLAYETDNLIYGRTNNPYNLSRSPGGSSGGAAAIIAAGGSPLDLGSDTAGSIRLPAHFSGVAGLKPTSGRVPRTGHIVGPGGPTDSLTTLGPLARRVEDLALTLPLIAGPDWRDPFIVPMPLGDPAAVSLKELRVAFFTDNRLATPTPEIMDTVTAATGSLIDAGLRVEEARPAGIEQSTELLVSVFLADGGAGIRRMLERAGTTEVHPFVRRFIDDDGDRSVSAAEFGERVARWDEFRATMLAFLENYDVILCPVNARPALPHGFEFEPGTFSLFSYTQTFNLTGWPGVVVRGGTSPEGLPLGVQVVARPWREDVALAVAQHLETALGGWQPSPLFA